MLEFDQSNLVVDEYFYQHILSAKLGEGGQGAVYRSKDPDIAIKLFSSGGEIIRDPTVRNQVEKKIQYIRRLPIPEKIHIAMPIALLREMGGYVMSLLTDMIPFEELLSIKSQEGKIPVSDHPTECPAWLIGAPQEAIRQLLHYLKTGGLKRRLTVLAKGADILCQLHGAGLVYSDVSASNFFLSSDETSSEVWLIDADNVSFSERGMNVYTPRYGAPELVRMTGKCSFASDSYAFAILVFWLLTMVHPFMGKLVENGGWDSEDYEALALAGYLPWVGDPDDASNKTISGLPRSLVLNDELTALFQETFGPGREAPWRRPTVFQWAQALHRAADCTIVCPACRMSWYATDNTSCPYCKAPTPQYLLLNSYKAYGSLGKTQPIWSFIVPFPPSETTFWASIPMRLFTAFAHGDYRDAVKFDISANALILRPLDDRFPMHLALSNDSQNFERFTVAQSISIKTVNRSMYMMSEGATARIVHCMLKPGGNLEA